MLILSKNKFGAENYNKLKETMGWINDSELKKTDDSIFDR
mgnify:CR=1 FL=1